MNSGLSQLGGARELFDDEFTTMMRKLDANIPLVDANKWNSFVAGLKVEGPLDPLSAVEGLARCSAELSALLRADLGLLRPCRGGEHAQAVLRGFEDDYRMSFAHDEESLLIMRLTALVQDIGKPLSVKSLGDNRTHLVFTRLVLGNLLAQLDDQSMSEQAREALFSVIDQNCIGMALLGDFDQAGMERLRQRCPERFLPRFDDYVVVAYLCDASAHSTFRSHVDSDTGLSRPSVRASDTQLTHLFHREGNQPVTLTEPYRSSVMSLFPGNTVLSASMTTTGDQSVLVKDRAMPEQRHPEQSHPEQRHPERRYEVVATASGTWSAVLKVPTGREKTKQNTVKSIEKKIHRFAKRSGFPVSAFMVEGRYGIDEVVLTRDPSRSSHPAAPSVSECEQAAAELARTYGWRRADSSSSVDLRVCVGLLEGYRNDAIQHCHVEALPVLLSEKEIVRWNVKLAYLVSARKTPGPIFSRSKLFTWKEKVLVLEGKTTIPEGVSSEKAAHISSSAGESATRSVNGQPQYATPDDLVYELASLFNQDRIFLDDYRLNQSIALKQVK
jgi:hypothetical protein